MARSVGLRTEIIFHVTLLLGAALLFGGFLLLKLTERELLNQRVDSLMATMEIVAQSLGHSLAMETPPDENRARAVQLLHLLPGATEVGAWQLVGGQLVPLYTSQAAPSLPAAARMQPRFRYLAETEVFLSYGNVWPFWKAAGEPSLEVVVPLRNNNGTFAGILQSHFSLDDVARRVRGSQKMVLLYVLLYGCVLFLFGLYLLNRNVVRPINGLMATTRQVADGNLDLVVPEQGPREISALARSFNDMVGALRASRRSTEDHIRSLQQANENLQQTRAELIRSEKMASVGHLAAGMAHEVGNPLGAVVGYLELLKAELSDERQRDIADRAAEEAGRIDRLVRELLDYAAPGKARLESFDPAAVMKESLELLSNQGRFNLLQLVRDLPPSLPPVHMVRHQLLQVFVNLLLNACDASCEGGTIRVEADVLDGSVRLAVADEGEGIPAENLGNVFDPFFTTKAPGKGRGLGLAVCYRVVAEAGGDIEVRSEFGKGSSFTVRLPVDKGEEHDE
jgi:two-component system NtrC family sensor kinase